jgi:hypothetical protein
VSPDQAAVLSCAKAFRQLTVSLDRISTQAGRSRTNDFAVADTAGRRAGLHRDQRPAHVSRRAG